ncbi:TetR/AcrR family transcriptional regulator [Paenibacillus sp. UNC451MF]|uniref:TetR/AcrR family transcriptional regulator n=1 Tax=Paenibacillus sp. UNC451MF TaxID=1449063 RepID=UPI00048C95AC|nr:TetR/AcrR family transcriptional regulator [Paenibacillus sp. UNC451MF]
MPRTNIPEARKRILQAAIQIFAEKSFEGARIDQIAEEARVPKSLIYYHFQSKEHILEVLFEDFIREYSELLQTSKKDTHQSKAETMQSRLQTLYKDFAIRNADIIRIMFIDSLKKSNRKPIIYKVVDAMINAEQANAVISNSNHSYDPNERRIAEFFTGIIPLFSYLCFSDSWVDYFEVEKKRFDELFLRIMMSTHGAYHQDHQ